MREPIDSEYFNWLCAKVLMDRPRLYHDMLCVLHQTEFAYFIPGDRNRANDGCELRFEFLTASGWELDIRWMRQPCSVFEALYAFSLRASFQTDISAVDWFWEFMDNLNLADYRQMSSRDRRNVEDILHTFVWRTYDDAGYGGLFPMRRPKHDQREVEIWYQFCEYLEDRGLI